MYFCVMSTQTLLPPVKVALTPGDLHGVGMELILQIFADPAMASLCTPILYVPAKAFNFYRKSLGTEGFWTFWKEGMALTPGKCYIKSVSDAEWEITPGMPSSEGAKAGLDALHQATADVASGFADVLVTGPIDKQWSEQAGFTFPGHTEYLADQWKGTPLMLMVHEGLRVALATGHVALGDVAKQLSPKQLKEKINVLEAALLSDFGVRRPRIALLGLNPHAGDGGKFGDEEHKILEPILQENRKGPAILIGPYSADGFFGAGHWQSCDAVMAMYHDQGLIPFKTLSQMDGVNYTAGLSFVRTSPDHGPAFDIVGKGKAKPDSMRNAIYLAIDVFRTRLKHKEISANPLKALSRDLRDVNAEDE